MDNLLIFYITAGIVVLILVIIWVWYLINANSFKKNKQNIADLMIDIDDIILNKHNLLNLMIEQTKRSLAIEAKILNEMLEIAVITNSDSVEQKQDISFQLTQSMHMLYEMITEHKDLKTSKVIKEKLDDWIILEESLQSTRKLYNTNVSSFNHKIVAFPSNIIAKIKKYKRIDFFEVDILLTKEEVDSL